MPSKPKPKYLLVPGWVQSAHDKDWHYITVEQLKRLYKLPWGSYVSCGIRLEEWTYPAELIRLGPRSRGDYEKVLKDLQRA